MKENKKFDVIIIGGSYAGLSAAMALGRSLRETMVIDGGEPCNAPTPHSHNFLTQDGKTPKEISKIARQQVANYDTVHFCNEYAVAGIKTDNGFEISTQTGKVFKSKKIILATGIKDVLPDIEGFKECWGKSVIHCPYCHGYEFRNAKTGIWANGDAAFHLASLVNNLTSELTVFTNGKPSFSEEQRHKLNKSGIPVIETEIARIEHKKGFLKTVILDDESKIELDALYAKVPFHHHSDISHDLGCEHTKEGYIQIDDFKKTSVPGVFACGDNSSAIRSVANAVSGGNFAGAMVNKELTEDQF